MQTLLQIPAPQVIAALLSHPGMAHSILLQPSNAILISLARQLLYMFAATKTTQTEAVVGLAGSTGTPRKAAAATTVKVSRQCNGGLLATSALAAMHGSSVCRRGTMLQGCEQHSHPSKQLLQKTQLKNVACQHHLLHVLYKC